MKRIAFICSGLIVSAGVMLYSLHLSRLAEAALTPPHSVKIDFSAHGVVWKSRQILSVEFFPVGRNDLSPEKTRAMKNFVRRKYGAKSLGFYCARNLAEFAVPERRASSPVSRAVDSIFLSGYLYLRYDEKVLLDAFLNKRVIHSHLAGIQSLSSAAYRKPVVALSTDEFISLFRFYCAPSVKNISPLLYAPIAIRAGALSIKNDESTGGSAADWCEHELRREGLYPPSESIIIDTTIDPSRQSFLETTAVRCLRNFEGQPPFRVGVLKKLPEIEGAAVICDTGTGGILAMVGSVSYGNANRLNRCGSRRQISSTFKPFLYAQAFEDGVCQPGTVFVDKPVMSHHRDGTVWEPKNFYPYFIGEVKARDALSLSINTVSVQLIEKVGVRRMAEKARRIFYLPESSINERIGVEPSLALGSIDLTPVELAKGYLSLASMGAERFPHILLSVKTASGKELWRRKDISGKQLYEEKSCRTVISVLQNVIRTGTASKFIRKKFPFDAAGKSGSSSSDSWFAGFNPETLIVVWAGYDMPLRAKEGKIPEFTVIPFWYALMAAESPGHTKF